MICSGGCSGGDKGEEVGPQRSSDRHRTGNDPVFQHDADHQEDKIQHEHDETEQLAHAPLAGGDGDDDEEKHEEEEHDGTEEAIGADLHWAEAVEQGPEEPGKRQSANTQTCHMLFLKVTVGPLYKAAKSPKKHCRYSGRRYFCVLGNLAY